MSDWLIPYLTFNGNCEDAVKFYQTVLGGESHILHFGDAPPNSASTLPEEVKKLVMHAELRKSDHVIRFSDSLPGIPYNPGENITFSLEFDTLAETEEIYESLSAGGSIQMELQKTFFSPLFSKFKDKFGITWMVSCRAK